MDSENPPKKLSNKVSIITGAGSGMGAASARRLASEGARVFVVDLDGSAAQKVAEEINGAGGLAISKTLDVSSRKDVIQLVGEAVDQFGPIDILVNNAGFSHAQKFVDMDDGMWERTIAVNLNGPMFFSHAVLPGMMERNSGKIINVASTAAHLGAYLMTIYSATKAGLVGFSKALAREVARYNINVNVICPGPIETPMFYSMPENVQEATKKSTIFRRLGQPEDIAAAVSFLASDDSSFITGHSLMVDGGQTMI